jgi:hypothetical protein
VRLNVWGSEGGGKEEQEQEQKQEQEQDRAIHLVRLIPNSSLVVVVTSWSFLTFSSSTGRLMKRSNHTPVTKPHSIDVSPDSRFLLVASPNMVTVVVAHDLEIVQICCRVLSKSKLDGLRDADALRTRSIDGAEVMPDGTVLVESNIASAALSLNGDIAFVGCDSGELHAFTVGLNRG